MSKSKSVATTNNADIYNQLPPQAIDMERAVLGVCMIEADAFEVVSEILNTQDAFFQPQHKEVFHILQTMFMRQKSIDVLTVIEELKLINRLEAAGGSYYLAELTNDVVGSAHLEEYCLRIQQCYISRKIIAASTDAISKAYAGQDCFNNSDELIRTVETVTQKSIGADTVSFEEGSFEAIKDLSARREQGDKLTGHSSGYHALDHCTHGWQDTDLIILAARPSVGKTALAINFAYNAASNPEKPIPVAFFSLEMSQRKLIERLISIITGVDAEAVARANFTDEQFEQIQRTLASKSKIPLYIDDTAGMNYMDLRAKLRRMVRLYGIKMAIIDYLQLMADVPDGERNRNREQVISNISRNIKKLAKDLKIPIIALSQLSRAVEGRGGEKIPQLSDLRESGAIEQDADVVMFLYRPEYYSITSDENGDSTRGVTDVVIAKHRNGKLDTIRLRSRLSIQKFENFGELTPELVNQRVESSGFKKFGMWNPGNDKD